MSFLLEDGEYFLILHVVGNQATYLKRGKKYKLTKIPSRK